MTTINEAILDTLRTKEGKEPRHRELLESLGCEVSEGWDHWLNNHADSDMTPRDLLDMVKAAYGDG